MNPVHNIGRNFLRRTFMNSSDISIDMDKEYMFQNYPSLRAENDSVYGVEDRDEVVFEVVDYDELCYVLSEEGTHMILFGGIWSGETQKSIAPINYCARKYGVDTIYLFDFSVNGKAETTIKQDITAQETYDGPGKRESNPFAVYNYLYGELVRHHLTNLNDWVEGKVGTKDEIAFLDLYDDLIKVPNLAEPFLFIYNKDNPDPIMWAVELAGYCQDEESICAALEDKIFSHVGEDGCEITPYSHADYIREAFSMNERGHSFKTQNAFTEDEQINIQKICYQEFRWLIKQEGSYLIELAGPWCAYSQGSVATVNDYAVANGIRVYMTDRRIDSKHAIDFWKYARQNELTISCPPMVEEYVDLWENYFKRAQISCALDPSRPWHNDLTVDYIDDEGKRHSALQVGVPFILSYNKDHVDQAGIPTPILASQHDSGELINTSEQFIYYEPNYRWFTGAIYRVFYMYQKSLGKEMHDKTIDRTAPLVEGEIIRHVETVAHHQDHDWEKEQIHGDSASDEGGCCG